MAENRRNKALLRVADFDLGPRFIGKLEVVNNGWGLVLGFLADSALRNGTSLIFSGTNLAGLLIMTMARPTSCCRAKRGLGPRAVRFGIG